MDRSGKLTQPCQPLPLPPADRPVSIGIRCVPCNGAPILFGLPIILTITLFLRPGAISVLVEAVIDHLSLNLAISCELYQIVAVGYRFDGHPRLQRGLARLIKCPVFQSVSKSITEQGEAIRKQDASYLDLDSAFS